jgi:hypothetical protein
MARPLVFHAYAYRLALVQPVAQYGGILLNADKSISMGNTMALCAYEYLEPLSLRALEMKGKNLCKDIVGVTVDTKRLEW